MSRHRHCGRDRAVARLGLYTYRLDNIPLFVPPGHVLLLLLGLRLARRMSENAALAIIGGAGGCSIALAAAQVDTLGVWLFGVLLTASLAVPEHRRLYASTFLLALGLELLGTWLGNWGWAREVSGTPLVTTNPPLTAGAFYCALDALVVVAAAWLAPRLPGAVGQERSTKVQTFFSRGVLPSK